MLASPLMPTSTSTFTPEDPHQYRPSRDLDSFNKLLPPPIEFVEGSSSGTLAVAEGTYEPINVTPKLPSAELPEKSPKPSIHHSPVNGGPMGPTAPTSPTSAKTSNSLTSLYQGGIDASWPTTCSRGAGLRNTGNTCFLNSALQCLIHTPPLLRVLIAHRDICRSDKGMFCMACRLRVVAIKAHTTSEAFTPISITERLQTIAKHMKRGRQEDSHEFLRYGIDALQKSCLAGYPPKLDPKLAETTWVHKIFGGRLRSRVTCHDCGYNSDTFDRILDLSLDILRSDSLKDALKKFVAVDHLKGADKYKCEKCKKPVIAEKRFTIHEAPMVLTVHLKRFSPLGRKISHYIHYDDRLSLHPFMSEDQHGPSYSLYGVICHAGGGPNSGHYFAYVKDKDGRWWEMNDEMVSPIGGAPVKKNAYILFYMRNKGQGLEAAVNSAATPIHKSPLPPSHPKAGLAASMKKRKEREQDGDDEEDVGEKVSKPFIGPVIPDGVLSQRSNDAQVDMQSVVLKKKIEAAKLFKEKEKQEKAKLVKEKAAGLLAGLDSYNSDEEEEDRSEKESKETEAEPPNSPTKTSSPLLPPSSPSNEKKRKRDEDDNHYRHNNTPSKSEGPYRSTPAPITSRTSGYTSFKSGRNPYNNLSKVKKYGKQRRPGGI